MEALFTIQRILFSVPEFVKYIPAHFDITSRIVVILESHWHRWEHAWRRPWTRTKITVSSKMLSLRKSIGFFSCFETYDDLSDGCKTISKIHYRSSVFTRDLQGLNSGNGCVSFYAPGATSPHLTKCRKRAENQACLTHLPLEK